MSNTVGIADNIVERIVDCLETINNEGTNLALTFVCFGVKHDEQHILTLFKDDSTSICNFFDVALQHLYWNLRRRPVPFCLEIISIDGETSIVIIFEINSVVSITDSGYPEVVIFAYFVFFHIS